MSRITDRIQRALRTETAPIGFGAAAARRKEATLLLAMQLCQAEPERVGEAVAQGVDTIIFGLPSDGREAFDMGRWVKEAGDTPCGAWLGAAEVSAVTAAKEAGADYVVLSQEAAAAAVLDQEIGYMLALEEEMPDTLLRALDGLPLEAVVAVVGRRPLSLRRQLELRRLAGLSRLPLFLRLEDEPTPQELESLRDVGTVAVLVDGGLEEAWAMLVGLRRAIDCLPPRRRRREERLEAVLPQQQAEGLAEEEEEEEFQRQQGVE